MLNHHATHPRHLIAYDENGSLVEPKKMNFVQSETDFVYTLLKYQQEFDRSLEKPKMMPPRQTLPSPNNSSIP